MNFSPTIYPTNSSSLTGDVVEAGGPEPVHPSVGTGHPPRPPGRVPPRRGGEGAPGRACAERVWRRRPAAAEVGRRGQQRQQQRLLFATGEAIGLRDIPGLQARHRGEPAKCVSNREKKETVLFVCLLACIDRFKSRVTTFT